MNKKVPISREADNRLALKIQLLFFVYFVAVAAMGCSRYSPTHHTANPWLVGSPMTQVTSVLEFNYTGYAENARESGIRGSAKPVPRALPDWIVFYEQAAVMVYVTDQSGRILEQHRIEYDPGYKVGEPLYFDVKLDSPVRLDDRSFQISFGYFLLLTEFNPVNSEGGRRIIRHEAGYQ